MYTPKFITIGIITGFLLLLQGCYMERVLSRHDLDFEERKNQVESYTEFNGIRRTDRILSYVNQAGQEISLPSIPVQQKIKTARVNNDTLYLYMKKNKPEGIEICQAIPVSDIQKIRVKRYLKRPTTTIAILGSIGILVLLSFI